MNATRIPHYVILVSVLTVLEAMAVPAQLVLTDLTVRRVSGIL